MLCVAIIVSKMQLAHTKVVEPDRSAVLFRNKGTVELSGRSYYVLIDININNLLETIEPIGASIQRVSTSLEQQIKKLTLMTPRRTNKQLMPIETNTNASFSIDDPYNPLFSILSKSMQEHLKFLLKELDNRHNSLVNFLQSMSDIHLNPSSDHLQRNSRGLFNAGGALLNWLIGTATDDEINSTNEILERLSNLAEDTQKQVNLHASMLNETYIHFKSISQQVT